MEDGQLPYALFLLVMIVFIASGLVGRGLGAGKAAKWGFAWIAIFAVAFALFTFRGDLGTFGARLKSEAMGETAAVVSGGALRVAKRDEMEGRTVVTVLPSCAERYISTALFEGIEG